MATWQLAPETAEQALTRSFMERIAELNVENSRLRAQVAILSGALQGVKTASNERMIRHIASVALTDAGESQP